MCAARSQIAKALLKQNVVVECIQSACRNNGSRQNHRKYCNISRHLNTSTNTNIIVDNTAETVTTHALINQSIKPKSVSDFQELYEATKKKFQCKP